MLWGQARSPTGFPVNSQQFHIDPPSYFRYNVIMIKIKSLIILCFLGFLSMGKAAADVHVIVESKFMYRSMERKTTLEYWVTDKKTYRKFNHRVQITRDDLGLTWNIDGKRKSYREKKIDTPGKPPSKEKVDIHTLEFDYEPVYHWTVKETGETKIINGFACRCFLVEGDSDFSEIQSTYWMCTDAKVPGAAQFHRLSLKRQESEKSGGGLLEILKKHKNSFPVLMEEVMEGPVASTSRHETTLLKLEETAAPPGIYDIPKGFGNSTPVKTGKGDGQ